MAKIYKYHLGLGHTALSMPEGAQVLTVQMQHGEACMWAKVDPSKPLEVRVFHVYGTGHEMPNDPLFIYVGTFQMANGAFVWHVFDATHTA